MYFYNLEAKNFTHLISILNDNLLEKDWVKKTFKEAIIKREKNYPTGLLLKENATVAIPHTDSEHVKVNKIIPIKLKSKIDFFMMGTLDQKITVDTIFVLLVKEKDLHIDKISGLINLFQKEDFIHLLKNNNETNFKKIVKIIDEEI